MADTARILGARFLSAARLGAACACLALLPAASSGAVIAAARGKCTNPEAMARFTLECVKTTNNTLYDCYGVAAQIYCAPPPPAPVSPTTAPPTTAPPAAKATAPKGAAKQTRRAKKK